MVKRITHGEYEIRLENKLGLTGEFLWLKDDICKLSSELRHEKILRERLENDKKQMILDISHDLRNPLATIMGYAETLSSIEVIDEEKRTHYAEVIYRNSVHTNSLMKDLFIYTKLDYAGFQLTLLQGDICEFIREQVSLFLPQFEAASVETEFAIPEMEILMMFDSKLLERTFVNMFDNCIAYNNDGTKLTLLLVEDSSFVQIVVADDGVGMDKSLSKTIFEPFVRADQTRNSKTGGSGLGLAITAKIIKAHQGSIELDTEPGKGCRFLIRLKK